MNHQHLHDILGLQFMPVKANKQPIVKGWQTTTAKHDLSNCEAVGLVCGRLSGNLEVIDVDTKYDLTGKLFERYKSLVHSVDSDLLNKLSIQKTKSGGYHLLYRCSKIAGNLKLANRNTTDAERKETFDYAYQVELQKSKTDEEAKAVAQKASDNDKVRVLFETRGEGGYIMCSPSKGYDFIFADLLSIQEITEEERETLHSIARQFNEVVEEYKPAKYRTEKIKEGTLSPFEDYNNRGDIVALLENHGWKNVGRKGKKIIFLRPGQTTSASSGNFDEEKNWFSVFSTSTEFRPESAYLPYAVFAKLECNDDYSEASKRLYEIGYGDRREEKEKTPSTRAIPSRINPEDDDYSFLATGEDYNDYLQQVIDGTLPMGLTTGSPAMDEHFLFKKGNLVMFNGHDNVGKSVFVWWLLMLAAIYHGWRGIIFSSENTLGGFMRKMIQFYWGKPIAGFGAQTPEEYQIAKAFVERHFILIKAQENLYNYKDIMNMVKKARKKYSWLDYGMIDPYNSLKTDLSGYSKLSTHDYQYEGLSEIKAYGQVTKFGWFINHHCVTESLRKLDSEGYPIAPNKADTEGGGKVPNKADDFGTVHRKVQHPTEWMVTEFHIRKIKDTETGGKHTHLNSPLKFEMHRNQCGFKERLEMGGLPIDPIYEWHVKNGTIKEDEYKSSMRVSFNQKENDFKLEDENDPF